MAKANWWEDIMNSRFMKAGLGGKTTDVNGITTETSGFFNPAFKGMELFQNMGAIDDMEAYRDRMMEFQETLGYGNLAMSRDAYNRKANLGNAVQAKGNLINSGNMNAADHTAEFQKRATGGSIINADGTSYNIVDIDPKYTGEGYNQSGGTSMPAPTPTPASTNTAAVSKFAKPNTAGVKTNKPALS